MITIGNEYFLTEMKLLDCNTVEAQNFSEYIKTIYRTKQQEIKVN